MTPDELHEVIRAVEGTWPGRTAPDFAEMLGRAYSRAGVTMIEALAGIDNLVRAGHAFRPTVPELLGSAIDYRASHRDDGHALEAGAEDREAARGAARKIAEMMAEADHEPLLRPDGTGLGTGRSPAAERYRRIFMGHPRYEQDVRSWERPVLDAIERLGELYPDDPEFAEVDSQVRWAMALSRWTVVPEWIDSEIDALLAVRERPSLPKVEAALRRRAFR